MYAKQLYPSNKNMIPIVKKLTISPVNSSPHFPRYVTFTPIANTAISINVPITVFK